jgi:hypothetical protein
MLEYVGNYSMLEYVGNYSIATSNGNMESADMLAGAGMLNFLNVLCTTDHC